jgi:uncharacterized protein (TIGR03083 family)
MQTRDTFDAAATAFLDLVARIPQMRYAGPGLGDWDLRSLVGHAGRSFVTVSTHLETRAETIAAESPAAYFAIVSRIAAEDAVGAITQRGIDAGVALGDDPLAALRAQKAAADAALDALDGDPVVETICGGMRVSGYLQTRTFELTVHGIDVARATGLEFAPPPAALVESLDIAAESALALGMGVDVLLALTGRQQLPPNCSVVP